MKRLFFLTLLAAVAVLGATAQTLDYLTIRLSDGTEQSLTAVGTKITFSDGKLLAVNGEESATYDVSEVAKMYFSATPTSIAALPVAQSISAAIVDGHLKVTAPAGTSVALYTAEGRRISTSAHLTKGLYVVRIGNETLKLLSE